MNLLELALSSTDFIKSSYDNLTKAYLNINCETYNFVKGHVIIKLNLFSEKPIMVTDFLLETDHDFSYSTKSYILETIQGINLHFRKRIDQSDTILADTYPQFEYPFGVSPVAPVTISVIFTDTHIKNIDEFKNSELIIKLGNTNAKIKISYLISEVQPLREYVRTRLKLYSLDLY